MTTPRSTIVQQLTTLLKNSNSARVYLVAILAPGSADLFTSPYHRSYESSIRECTICMSSSFKWWFSDVRKLSNDFSSLDSTTDKNENNDQLQCIIKILGDTWLLLSAIAWCWFYNKSRAGANASMEAPMNTIDIDLVLEYIYIGAKSGKRCHIIVAKRMSKVQSP